LGSRIGPCAALLFGPAIDPEAADHVTYASRAAIIGRAGAAASNFRGFGVTARQALAEPA